MTKKYKTVHFHDGTTFTVSSIEERSSQAVTRPDGTEIRLRKVSYPSGLKSVIPESEIASVDTRTVEVWDGRR